MPGASRTALAGRLGEAVKVRVAAPPERGKANDAVLALLANVLDVPAGALSIASGHASPRKTVRVEGLTDAEVRQRIARASEK